MKFNTLLKNVEIEIDLSTQIIFVGFKEQSRGEPTLREGAARLGQFGTGVVRGISTLIQQRPNLGIDYLDDLGGASSPRCQ